MEGRRGWSGSAVGRGYGWGRRGMTRDRDEVGQDMESWMFGMYGEKGLECVRAGWVESA